MPRSDRIVIAAAAGAAILALAAISILFLPAEQPPSGTSGVGATTASVSPASDAPGAGTIVVDVEGGVVRPGIRELPAGSRVADAIAAAGGFGHDADVAAAATLNLAQPLVDGQQVRVPRVGDAAIAGQASSPATGAGGLVNLNTATPEELEALPGIGSVTVQKIVAAREERPFSSLEDAVTRGVIHNGQLEDIRELATAG